MLSRLFRPAFALLLLLQMMALHAAGQSSPLTPAPMQLLPSSSPADFGSLAVGQTSGAASFNFAFTTPASIGSVRVLTEGREAGAFAAAPGSGTACQPGAYAPGATCTVTVAFTPGAAGVARGAIAVQGADGQPLATAYLSGAGMAPALLFTPGKVRGGGPWAAAGAVSPLALDGSGTLYSNEGSRLVRHSADGAADVWLINAGVTCLASDGAGYVYACENGAIVTFAPDGTRSRRAGANAVPLGGTPANAVGLAIDAAGVLFVAEVNPRTGLADVREMGIDGRSSVVLALTARETIGSGLAVDGAGTLYALTNRAVRAIHRDGSTAVLAQGNYSASSAWVDAAGTLYIASGALLTTPGQIPVFANGGTLSSGQAIVSVGAVAIAGGQGAGVLAAATGYAASPNLPVSYALVELDQAGWQSLGFPQTMAGATSATESIAIRNGGNQPLTLTAVDASAPFAMTPAKGACSAALTLAPGAACNLSLVFQPQAAGPAAGALTLTDDSAGQPGTMQTVALSGSATSAAPVLTWSAGAAGGAVDFGQVLIGTAAPSRTITLTNTGSVTAAFTGAPGLSGANAADFRIGSTTCSASLAPGQSCSVTLGFAPAALGQRSGTLYIQSLGGVTANLPLYGTGLNANGGQLEISFSQYDFGAVMLGASSGPVQLTVLNTTQQPMLLAIPPFSGSGSTDFRLTGNTFATGTAAPALGAGASCTLSIMFAPAVVGPRSASLTLGASGLTSPLSIAFSGTGATPVALDASSSPADFGKVAVGASASASYTFRFAADATVGSVAVLFEGAGETGAAGTEFAPASGDANACRPVAYAAGSFCTVSVHFQPSAPGLRSGAILLADASARPLLTAYISGVGVAPASALGPGRPIAVATFPASSGSFPVAMDGAGTVYLGAPQGTVQAAPGQAQPLLVGSAAGMALDGAGNLYIADGRGPLLRRSPAGVTTTVGTHSALTGVAVDGRGRVFATDLPHVYQNDPDGTEQTLRTFQYLPGSQLSTGPTGGIAVDPAGTVHVMTCYGMALFASDGSYTPARGTVCSPTQAAMLAVDASGVSFAAGAGAAWAGVGIALNGDLLYVTSSPSENTLWRVVRSQPQPVSVAGVDTTAFHTTLTNYGNAPLSIADLHASGSFALSATPNADACASGTALSAGASCAVQLITPVAGQAATGALNLTTDALNTPGSLQLLPLSVGGAVATPATVTLAWTATAAVVYGSGLSAAQLNATASAPGTLTYAPAAGTVLAAGVHTLSVSFTPANTAAYAVASAQVPITVLPASTATILSSSATSVAAGEAVTLTASVTPVSGGSQLSGTPLSGTVQFLEGGQPLSGALALGVDGTATWTVANLSVGAHVLTARYASDANHTGSASDALAEIIVAQTPAQLTPSSPTVAIGAGQTSAKLGLVVVAPSTFSGTITLSCSGLPLGGSCAFAPASLNVAPGNIAAPLNTAVTLSLSGVATGADTVAAVRMPVAGHAPENEGLRENGLAVLMSATFYLPGAWSGLLLFLRRGRRAQHLLLYCGVLALMGGAIGCGGVASATPPSSGTPAPSSATYAVTITATGMGTGGFSQNAIVTLTVTR